MVCLCLGSARPYSISHEAFIGMQLLYRTAECFYPSIPNVYYALKGPVFQQSTHLLHVCQLLPWDAQGASALPGTAFC